MGSSHCFLQECLIDSPALPATRDPHSRPDGQRLAGCADKTGLESQDSDCASAKAFLAALLRLQQSRDQSEALYGHQEQKKSSCILHFHARADVDDSRRGLRVRGEEEGKKRSFVALTGFSFRRKGREYELQRRKRRKDLCEAVSRSLFFLWSSST